MIKFRYLALFFLFISPAFAVSLDELNAMSKEEAEAFGRNTSA